MINLISDMYTSSNKLKAFNNALYRTHLPNLNQLIFTIVIIFAVVYFKEFKVSLPFKHSRVRGHTAPFTIQLLYTSVKPVMYIITVMINLALLSYGLSVLLPSSHVTEIIGTWAEKNGALVPENGLCYYIFSKVWLRDPVRALLYMVFIVITVI